MLTVLTRRDEIPPQFLESFGSEKGFNFVVIPHFVKDESDNIVQTKEDLAEALSLTTKMFNACCTKKSTTADGISYFIMP